MTHSTAPNHAPSQAVSLLDIFNAILEGWKIIALVTTFILLGALLFLFVSRPIYEVNAVIQIDQASKGMSSQLAPIEAMLTGTLPSDGEIELIRSRSVVGKAVDKFHLEISAHAKRFFLVGTIAAAINKGVKNPVSPWFWMNSYGWGGEIIKINILSLPKALVGETMILTALNNNMFKLSSSNGKLLFKGKVGEYITQKGFSIEVSQLRARPSTEFEIVASSRYDTIVNLQRKLEISELGSQSGVIKIVYNNANSGLAAAIVNTIVDGHVELNISRKAEEASKTLQFLTVYLPQSKEKLASTEQALSDFQSQHDTVALEQETRGLLERTVNIQSQLEQLQLERQDLRQRFSDIHPSVIALDNKIRDLNKLLTVESIKMKGLPMVQRELLGLTREVNVSTEMYTYLMNRTQELRLMKAGTVGDIRVIDRAERSFKPIFPIPSVLIAVAIFLGLMLGIVLVVLRLSLQHGVKTAEDIESATNGVVYAVLPFTEKQAKLPKSSPLLAKEEPKNITVEALRNFVVNLHFTLVDTKKQSIAISGISPNAGKSFVSSNLAYLLAKSEKRVLLIDADMRKGLLAKTFNVAKAPGLSDLLSSDEINPSALNAINEHLTLITSGYYPPNPVDLLMCQRFLTLMDEWEKTYDFIIMDTPPVLSVADATIIAEQVGSTFLVVRAGENSVEDVLAASKRFENINQPIHGYLLNGFVPDLLSSKGYGKYAYYGYGAYTDDK